MRFGIVRFRGRNFVADKAHVLQADVRLMHPAQHAVDMLIGLFRAWPDAQLALAEKNECRARHMAFGRDPVEHRQPLGPRLRRMHGRPRLVRARGDSY